MSGGDHIHSGTVVGKLEGEREMTLGFVDLLRDDFTKKGHARGIFFCQGQLMLMINQLNCNGRTSFMAVPPVNTGKKVRECTCL